MYFQDFLHFFYLIRLISNSTLVCQPVSRNPLYVTLLSSFADVVGRCCGQVFHQRFNCQVRHRRFLEGPVRTKGCREGSQGKGMKIGRALNFGVSFCEWVPYICKVCKFFYTTLLYVCLTSMEIYTSFWFWPSAKPGLAWRRERQLPWPCRKAGCSLLSKRSSPGLSHLLGSFEEVCGGTGGLKIVRFSV